METKNVNLVINQEKLLEMIRGKEITEELALEVVKGAGKFMTDEELKEVAEEDEK